MNSLTGDVDAIAAHYVRQEWIAIDPGITNDISFSQQRLAEFQVDSQSNDNTLG